MLFPSCIILSFKPLFHCPSIQATTLYTSACKKRQSTILTLNLDGAAIAVSEHDSELEAARLIHTPSLVLQSLLTVITVTTISYSSLTQISILYTGLIRFLHLEDTVEFPKLLTRAWANTYRASHFSYNRIGNMFARSWSQWATILLASASFTDVALGATADQWRSRSIYQIITDRFARTDGSTTASCPPGTNKYCGGSFTGIKNQLDYIQGMGFTAVSRICDRTNISIAKGILRICADLDIASNNEYKW